MRAVFFLLTLTAGLLTVFIAALVILSIASGGGSILLPGLGLISSLPFVIVVLTLLDSAIILCAVLLRRRLDKGNLP